MKTDLQIAQECTMEPITKVAQSLHLKQKDLELYGDYKAKIKQSAVDSVQNKRDGHLILVTAITPTPAGEGKSTVTIGLAEAMNQLGKKTTIALREPSLGPTLGLKGGAAGGGYAQVVPMEDLNLHFTGDIHAITTANNVISAALDNSIKQGNPLSIDPTRVVWKRCLDLNDRALRTITIAQGGKINGVERVDHFDITVASEIMAILCLSKDIYDLKERVGRCIVAYNTEGNPVTAKDLQCDGCVAVILKDAIKPNLIQTLEHTPAIVHGGPFANIAHGCNSIIATKFALKTSPYVVTEAGFGADLGAEKFLNIKCRTAGIAPSCVVIVATIRALKMHGGILKENLKEKNVEAMLKGVENLEKHIENIQSFHLPYVVAINAFATDSKEETEALEEYLSKKNHPFAYCDVWAKGGEGGIELAKVVLSELKKKKIHYTYSLEDSIKTKIQKLCKTIYGAKSVVYSEEAKKQIQEFEKMGFSNLPICMAKTQYSLSDNPKLLNRPKDFTMTIRELRISRGAGFIVVLTGDIMTMPGLPKDPALNHIDLVDGHIIGLF